MAEQIETRRLSDTGIRSLQKKPPAAGERHYVRSDAHKYVLLCATHTRVSFLYGTRRFPGEKHPTRRELGVYPNMTLEQAHAKARAWDALIGAGVDPRKEEARLANEVMQAELAAAGNTIDMWAAKYLSYASKQRQFQETKRIINVEILPVWTGRPIGSITAPEVKDLVAAIVGRGKLGLARNVLTVCKSFFDWALDDASPARGLRPTKLVGKKVPRQRVLSDDEVRSFWKATEQLQYPHRDLCRFLLLTGVRLQEAAGAKWSEIADGTWTIPPERFKSNCTHLVPLSKAVMQLLHDLPKFQGCDYLFTFDGMHQVSSFSRAKARLDGIMQPDKPWVLHDLRRVVRTGLAKLKVPDSVAELVIGHGAGSQLQRTYLVHSRVDELREALELWAGRVRDITTPPPANVSKLRRKA